MKRSLMSTSWQSRGGPAPEDADVEGRRDTKRLGAYDLDNRGGLRRHCE